MKEKLKKFYDDHEYGIGVAINSIAVFSCLYALKHRSDLKITGVKKHESDGRTCVHIERRSAPTQYWRWDNPTN